VTGSTSSGKHVESSGSSGGGGSESLGALNTGEGYFQCLISNLGQWFSWVCVSVLFLFGSTTGLDSQETSNAVEWDSGSTTASGFTNTGQASFWISGSTRSAWSEGTV